MTRYTNKKLNFDFYADSQNGMIYDQRLSEFCFADTNNLESFCKELEQCETIESFVEKCLTNDSGYEIQPYNINTFDMSDYINVFGKWQVVGF